MVFKFHKTRLNFSSVIGLLFLITFSIFSFSCKTLIPQLPVEERNQVGQFCNDLPHPPGFELYDKSAIDKTGSTLYEFVYTSKDNRFDELKKHYEDYLLPKGWTITEEKRGFNNWFVRFDKGNQTISINYDPLPLPFAKSTYYVGCSARA